MEKGGGRASGNKFLAGSSCRRTARPPMQRGERQASRLRRAGADRNGQARTTLRALGSVLLRMLGPIHSTFRRRIFRLAPLAKA
jgi:hypothetical protein